MKTVREVSRLTGVSVRTLHHYDAIDLLKPSRVSKAGYRLYDEAALERLYLILVFRELGMSLKEIGRVLEAPDHERNRVLEQQIQLMQKKVNGLQNRISLAKGIQVLGVNYMNFDGFDPKKIDEYGAQAKVLYGKTDAYQEFERKSNGRTRDQEADLSSQVMDFFERLGVPLKTERGNRVFPVSDKAEDIVRALGPCEPDSEAALAWAKELQDFFTEHFYTCTPQILRSLAQSYAGGGSMNENIDKAGGPGTGSFAKQVIDAYLESLS